MGEKDERTLESSPLAVETSAAVDDRLEDRDYLMKLLSKVSEEERMLLIQKEVEGLTVQELSEQTGDQREYHQGEVVPGAAEAS